VDNMFFNVKINDKELYANPIKWYKIGII